MATETIKRTARRVGGSVFGEFGLTAALNHYYGNGSVATPIWMWWFAAVLVLSAPASLYEHASKHFALPETNPFNWLVLVAMLGGGVFLIALHIGLSLHAKYLKSPYRLRYPVVRE